MTETVFTRIPNGTVKTEYVMAASMLAPRRATIRDPKVPLDKAYTGYLGSVWVLEIPWGMRPIPRGPKGKGVLRVMKTWENLRCGRRRDAPYNAAREEARRLCDQMNIRPSEKLRSWFKNQT